MLGLSRICLGASALVVSLACTTPTQMTDVWRDKSYAAGPLTNVIVFGGGVNATNRRTLEDGFVAALGGHGVRATPSYRLFPDELPKQEEVRDVVVRSGYDGVLVASMRGASETQAYVPGVYSQGAYWNGFYGPGWGPAWDVGYIVTNEYVKFETMLWDPRGNGKLVWSAVTQTVNPSSGKDFTTSLVKKVVPVLTEAGLLPPKPPGNAVSTGGPVLSPVQE